MRECARTDKKEISPIVYKTTGVGSISMWVAVDSMTIYDLFALIVNRDPEPPIRELVFTGRALPVAAVFDQLTLTHTDTADHTR